MYCKYCGQKIDDDSSFCSGCGAKLNIAVKRIEKNMVNETVATAPTEEDEEEFDPTISNIMAQFSPVGRIVFVLLCLLMILWVASLTLYIFYPEHLISIINL